MARPAFPPFSASRVKLFIFSALVFIAIVWWSVRLIGEESAVLLRQRIEREAVAAYHDGDPARSVRLYNRIIALSDSAAERVDNLQEQAAAYGRNGQYGKQLENHLRARKLADRYGLDSLRDISAESIGHIYAACKSNRKYCKGITGTSTLARWRAEKPAVLLLVSLLLFSAYMLLEQMGKKGPDVAER